MESAGTSRTSTPEPASAFALAPVLWVVGVVLSFALVTSESALTLLCVLVLFTAAAMKLWSWLSLTRLTCQLDTDQTRLFADEKLGIRARLRNDKLLPVWIALRVPLRGGAMRASTGLLSHQNASLRWQAEPLARGVYTLGPAELTASDPLGFYRRTKLACSCEVIVYPRLVPLRSVPLPPTDLSGRPTNLHALEDPTQVHGVRDYRGTRPARYMHWKASARLHRLVEKTFQPSAQMRVLFVLGAEALDQAESAVFERALELIASWTVELDRLRIPVGLATNCRLLGADTQITLPSRAAGQLGRVLETLARAEPHVLMPIEQLMTQLTGTAHCTLICVSHAPVAPWLTVKHAIHVVCGPAEVHDDESHQLADLHGLG